MEVVFWIIVGFASLMVIGFAIEYWPLIIFIVAVSLAQIFPQLTAIILGIGCLAGSIFLTDGPVNKDYVFKVIKSTVVAFAVTFGGLYLVSSAFNGGSSNGYSCSKGSPC